VESKGDRILHTFIPPDAPIADQPTCTEQTNQAASE
jgi:hypothetical protein